MLVVINISNSKHRQFLIQWNLPIADITNNRHANNSGQNVYSEIWQSLLVPPDRRHLLIREKIFKTCKCPLFRGFTVQKCGFFPSFRSFWFQNWKKSVQTVNFLDKLNWFLKKRLPHWSIVHQSSESYGSYDAIL